MDRVIIVPHATTRLVHQITVVNTPVNLLSGSQRETVSEFDVTCIRIGRGRKRIASHLSLPQAKVGRSTFQWLDKLLTDNPCQ